MDRRRRVTRRRKGIISSRLLNIRLPTRPQEGNGGVSVADSERLDWQGDSVPATPTD
jgi:hypothetical protein